MPFHQANYTQVDTILDVLEKVTKEELISAGQKLQNTILEETGGSDTGDVVDAAVSFDGTWAKRGLTSLTGVGFVVSVDTGEVLDYRVLSKLSKHVKNVQLKKVSVWEMIRGLKNGGENVWQMEIDINFTGSSPAMEAEGAQVLWKRSIEPHNIWYKSMASDGDSKAFKTIENIYSDCKVVKLDCVGHVQKMGKHLMNLKARTKGKLADGKPIGGRLTEGKIKHLQKY